MKLNLLQSLALGFLSGLGEILPVSGKAHRLLLLKIFGVTGEPAALALMIHLAIAFALFLNRRSHINRMMRALRLSRVPKKRRKRPLDTEGLHDFRLLLTATVPVVVALCLYGKTSPLAARPLAVAGLLVIGGVILYIPQYLPGANLVSGSLTPIDALIFGLGGAAGTLPGISPLGAALSLGLIRGMDAKNALNLALVLCIPVNLGLAAFDLLALFGGSITFGGLLTAIAAGAAAFAGVLVGTRLLTKITDLTGYCVFGFYSWGLALLTFALFLAAV